MSSNLHKRKTTKNKSKHQSEYSGELNKHQQQQQQHQLTQGNERLERQTSSEKQYNSVVRNIGDAFLTQKRSITSNLASAATTAKTRAGTTSSSLPISSSTTTSSLCCNKAFSAAATFVDCCRDINCSFNTNVMAAPLGEYFNERRERRSASHESSKSSSLRGSVTPTPSVNFEKETTPSVLSTTSKHSNKTQSSSSTNRDSSPDSGVGSDGDRLLGQQYQQNNTSDSFTINLQLDLFSWILFALAFLTRFYRLSSPPNVVFDEVHFGKFVSHYMRNIFFFDSHPPLGKQLIAGVVSFAGYDGNFTFSRIGEDYTANVPIFWLRFVPALCGSLLAPAVYKLLLTARLKRWTAMLGGLLVVLDNALLTQSRFIVMEMIIILFTTLGIYFLLHFHRSRFASIQWLMYGIAAAVCLTSATSVKYIGFFSFLLAGYLTGRYFWNLLYDPRISNFQIWMQTFARGLLFIIIPVALYLSFFYIHLQSLHKAGPHDSVMTSAFQASLDGGLASITKGQPLKVVHGSQITLRNTYGRTCWLHSHAHVYPVRYPDKRGSSHQQQVTCYSFKDVNNWWIVKRPEIDNLVVGDAPDVIRHGDVIQLVHGITSRALNSHDVAAPMTPSCQEVSCYIDYEIKMAPELLWRVDIQNRESEGDVWHAIKSEVRLIHESTNAALRFTGRQLPEWGFNQHEVVADRQIDNRLAIWNVEEHRYTKTQDQRERERQMLTAEMIPTKKTKLSFLEKFIELQLKMLWNPNHIQSHMYSSEPIEWPLLDKGIAYWAHNKNGSQIHLLGNIIIWYSGTLALLVYFSLGVFYLLRRRRLCFDIPNEEWEQFITICDIFFVGYLIHYLPYYFMDRTLFLYNYLPAFVFKLLLLCYVIEHIDFLLRFYCKRFNWLVNVYRLGILIWLAGVVYVFYKFWPLSNGLTTFKKKDLLKLRWKDTWDLILLN